MTSAAGSLVGCGFRMIQGFQTRESLWAHLSDLGLYVSEFRLFNDKAGLATGMVVLKKRAPILEAQGP